MQEEVKRMERQFSEIVAKYESAMHYFRFMKQRLAEVEKENIDLKASNQKLQQEAKQAQTELKQLQKNLVNIPEDFKSSQILAKIVSDKLKETGSVAELKEILDEYIQGIERCITFLHQ